MERIYIVTRPPIDKDSYFDWLKSKSQKLSVSNKGLVAFTTSFLLNERNPSTASFHLYIIDINTPTLPYHVAEFEDNISILQWDPTGTKVLAVDSNGKIAIFGSKDSLVSDWSQLFVKTLKFETFITACWFDSGRISTINLDSQIIKQPTQHLTYTDKIKQSISKASLRLFGNRPAEGCLLVSSTGLLCCLTVMTEGDCVMVIESIFPVRIKVSVADLITQEDGSFLLATSAGPINERVSVHSITLSSNNISSADIDYQSSHNQITITCKPMSSFHINLLTQTLQERESNQDSQQSLFKNIAHLKILNKSIRPEIAVEISGPSMSLLELWELDKNESETMQQWIFKGNCIFDKELIAIQAATSTLLHYKPQVSFIILSFVDSTVVCIRKENLRPLHTTTNIESLQNIQITCNQMTMIGIDSKSQLYAFKLPPLLECQDNGDLEVYTQYLLEYCLVTGNDWWDVLVSTKQNSIDSVCDKFQVSYLNQPKHLRDTYLNKQLMIRASFLRAIGSLKHMSDASDCYTILILKSIANTFKSFLRIQEDDSPASEYISVTSILKRTQHQSFFNLNTLVGEINEKDYLIDNNISQSLQPLINWVKELCIHILATQVHSSVNKIRYPGQNLIKDSDAIQTLRELLVLIKIWSRHNEACMPQVQKLLDSLDILASMFKLLSSLHLSKGVIDEKLSEEIRQFIDNVIVFDFDMILQPIGAASSLLFQNKESGIKFVYYDKSTMNPPPVSVPNIEGVVKCVDRRRVDVVRCVSLGVNTSQTLHQCTRCGSLSMSPNSTQRAWEQRWIATCICGGHWAQRHQPVQKLVK